MEISDIQDRLIQEFDPCEDWMDKYEILMGYGEKLPEMKAKYRTEKHSVSGCQSRLWMASEIIDGKIKSIICGSVSYV